MRLRQQLFRMSTCRGDTSGSDTGSWTCNVKLDQPSTYTGGPVQLTLVQNVNGQNVETVILDGQTITFPYTLAIAVQMGWIPEPYICGKW